MRRRGGSERDEAGAGQIGGGAYQSAWTSLGTAFFWTKSTVLVCALSPSSSAPAAAIAAHAPRSKYSALAAAGAGASPAAIASYRRSPRRLDRSAHQAASSLLPPTQQLAPAPSAKRGPPSALL